MLSGAELATIEARVSEYNAAIRTVAAEVGGLVVETDAALAEIAENGLVVGGIDYSTDFITGGLFSLDGVHPAAMGYAITANIWIEAINEHFGADLPPVDLFPYVFGPFAGVGTGFDTSFGDGAPIFTPKADRHLRYVLGIPSKARLARIKARGARPGATTDGLPRSPTHRGTDSSLAWPG